jgi:DNA (cytosine-5)-methyltransferase 1
MVSGPRARLAWRVLDAQHFGVPQRRARVFVVVDFGKSVDPAAVLFERKSMSRDTEASREARKDVAATLSARTKGGGGLGPELEIGGGLIPSHDTACTLTAREYKGALPEADLSTVVAVHGHIAHTLTAEGHDASEDGTGRGTPIFTFECKGSQVENRADGVCHTLRAMGHSGSHQNGGGHAAVAYAAQNWHVRRLTPRECERLQGFPDDHTMLPRGKNRPLKSVADELAYLRQTYPDMTEAEALRLAPDGPRYKAMGNSMAVPVVKWIMDRVRVSFEQNRAEK